MDACARVDARATGWEQRKAPLRGEGTDMAFSDGRAGSVGHPHGEGNIATSELKGRVFEGGPAQKRLDVV